MKHGVTITRQRTSVEAYGCTKDLSVGQVYDFMEELTKRLDMRIIVPPVTVRVPTVNAAGNILTDDMGVSSVLIWLESSSALHTWPKQGFSTLDVFSCKRYSPETVVNLMKEWFGTDDVRIVYADAPA